MSLLSPPVSVKKLLGPDSRLQRGSIATRSSRGVRGEPTRAIGSSSARDAGESCAGRSSLGDRSAYEVETGRRGERRCARRSIKRGDYGRRPHLLETARHYTSVSKRAFMAIHVPILSAAELYVYILLPPLVHFAHSLYCGSTPSYNKKLGVGFSVFPCIAFYFINDLFLQEATTLT